MSKNEILIYVFNNTLFANYANKMNSRLKDEIMSETISILSEIDEVKLKFLYDSHGLNSYVLTIIFNMVVNSMSPLNATYSKNYYNIDNLYNCSDNEEEDFFKSSEASDLITDIKAFLNKRSNISEEEALNCELFNRSFFGGETFEEISEIKGIPKTTVFTTVKDVKRIVKDKFESKYDEIRHL